MNKIIAVLTIIITFTGTLSAQYKGYDDGKTKYEPSSNNMILGFINPNNFTMNHSFNVSMVNTGTGNVSLTSYINSMNYRISDKLNISADVRFQYSPYASSIYGPDAATNLQNDLSGIALSRASLNYRISDNSYINVEFRQIDQSDYLNNYNNSYYNPFITNSRYAGY